MTSRRLLLLVLVAAGVLRAGDALACGVLEGNGASWVDGADVIVRARAVEQKGRKHHTIEEARKAGGRLGTTIVFERLEALKGRVPAALEFEGEFVDWADGNDPILPYTMVRKGGRGGNCFARNYTAGAEYLLMLKVRDGVLTPYWASVGATNELIAGPHDPWLRWVRAHLELRRQNHGLAGTMPAYCPDDMDLFPEMRCGFVVGGDRLDIDGFGLLRRFGRDGPRETRFTLPEHIHIDNVSAAVFDDDLLLVYGVGNIDRGGAEVARLNGRTLAIKWRLPLPGFNVSLATIEGDRLYLATHGAVMAVDLERVAFIWKHEGLYDRELSAFNAFERPVVGPEEVVFRESTDSGRSPRSIRVVKATGSVLSNR